MTLDTMNWFNIKIILLKSHHRVRTYFTPLVEQVALWLLCVTQRVCSDFSVGRVRSVSPPCIQHMSIYPWCDSWAHVPACSRSWRRWYVRCSAHPSMWALQWVSYWKWIYITRNTFWNMGCTMQVHPLFPTWYEKIHPFPSFPNCRMHPSWSYLG